MPPEVTICMECQMAKKKKKNIVNLSSAESAHKVVEAHSLQFEEGLCYPLVFAFRQYWWTRKKCTAQSMFRAKIRKIMYAPVSPVSVYKVGFTGVYIA